MAIELAGLETLAVVALVSFPLNGAIGDLGTGGQAGLLLGAPGADGLA
jgi:hypothetical protein